MRQIKTILWDVDGTLLDFEASEEACVHLCLKKYGAEINEEQMDWYSRRNAFYWKSFEQGEISKERVYLGRFEDFFSHLGIKHIDPDIFNREYQEALGNSAILREHALELCATLNGMFRQYVVTNGSTVAQTGKLKKSGLENLMDGIFISEQMGTEKPNKEFFDLCGREIPEYDPKTTMIIGDSLTSDMAGGNNAGLLCCWYNPQKKDAPEGLRIDYDISSLKEIYEILGISTCRERKVDEREHL